MRVSASSRMPQWLQKILGRNHHTARGMAARAAAELGERHLLLLPHCQHEFVSRVPQIEGPSEQKLLVSASDGALFPSRAEEDQKHIQSVSAHQIARG